MGEDHGVDVYADVVTQYAEFAAHSGEDSPCFGQWSEGVVGDPEVQAWIAGLPGSKKQPNLVFAAARWHGVPAPGPYAGLREALLADDGSIRSTVMSRSTQTNEVGRLATLLPAFVRAVPPPATVALLEVGVSAGLNLYPDRWGYAWSTPQGVRTLGPEPRLACEVGGTAPLPDELPRIGWRGGIDLNPLDVSDADQTEWLATLVWPEQEDRRRRLRHAVEVAREGVRNAPSTIVRGDLLDELPALVAEASAYADEVIVFHSAVITYLTTADRDRFQQMMVAAVADGTCRWISNEGPRVLPAVSETGPPPPSNRFVLGLDGRAVAHTHGHGRTLSWFG